MSADAMMHLRDAIKSNLDRTTMRQQEGPSFLQTLLTISAGARPGSPAACVNPLHWRTPQWFMRDSSAEWAHSDSQTTELFEALLDELSHNHASDHVVEQLLSLFRYLMLNSEQITEADSAVIKAFDAVVDDLQLLPRAVQLTRDAHLQPFQPIATPASANPRPSLTPPIESETLLGAGLSPNVVNPNKSLTSISTGSSKAPKKRKNEQSSSTNTKRKVRRSPMKKKELPEISDGKPGRTGEK